MSLPRLEARLDHDILVETAKASRPGPLRRTNEDAVLGHVPGLAILAVADGAGNASGAARRSLDLLRRLLAAEPPEAVEHFPAWRGWLRILDSSLLGIGESTLAAVAVRPGRLVGAYVGDSRVYLSDAEGGLRLLTAAPSPRRLGSGRIEPRPIHTPLAPGDRVVVMTDGAWGPLGEYRLRLVLAQRQLGLLPELPAEILDEAARAGGIDDMTAAVVRIERRPAAGYEIYELPGDARATNRSDEPN